MTHHGVAQPTAAGLHQCVSLHVVSPSPCCGAAAQAVLIGRATDEQQIIYCIRRGYGQREVQSSGLGGPNGVNGQSTGVRYFCYAGTT